MADYIKKYLNPYTSFFWSSRRYPSTTPIYRGLLGQGKDNLSYLMTQWTTLEIAKNDEAFSPSCSTSSYIFSETKRYVPKKRPERPTPAPQPDAATFSRQFADSCKAWNERGRTSKELPIFTEPFTLYIEFGKNENRNDLGRDNQPSNPMDQPSTSKASTSDESPPSNCFNDDLLYALD